MRGGSIGGASVRVELCISGGAGLNEGHVVAVRSMAEAIPHTTVQPNGDHTLVNAQMVKQLAEGFA